jgi:hypothetical protein
MLRRVFAVITLLAAVALSPNLTANAVPLPNDDARSIQAAIRGQLHALAQDDAEAAFALSTPSIRSQMGSPENFLRVIKEDYSPMYRHLVVIFSAPENLGDSIIQIVRLTDRESRVWMAIYSMQRDSVGSWKIDGCQLLETDSVSI